MVEEKSKSATLNQYQNRIQHPKKRSYTNFQLNLWQGTRETDIFMEAVVFLTSGPFFINRQLLDYFNAD